MLDRDDIVGVDEIAELSVATAIGRNRANRLLDDKRERAHPDRVGS